MQGSEKLMIEGQTEVDLTTLKTDEIGPGEAVISVRTVSISQPQ